MGRAGGGGPGPGWELGGAILGAWPLQETLLEVLAAASRYEVTVHDLVVATVDIPLACLR